VRMIFFPNIMPEYFKLPPANGVVFRTPSFCKTRANSLKCEKFYKNLELTGNIEICPYGFNSFILNFGKQNFIITGLRIEGFFNGKKLTDKTKHDFIPVIPLGEFRLIIEQLRTELSKQLEMNQLRQKVEESKRFIDPNIHEIRKLNKEIKSQAEHIQFLLSEKQECLKVDFLKFRADNIFATSSLLSQCGSILTTSMLIQES
jgi:hypothetical protein